MDVHPLYCLPSPFNYLHPHTFIDYLFIISQSHHSLHLLFEMNSTSGFQAANITSFFPPTTTRTGYVPEPNCGRGTLSIVWSCLTTAFLALWTAYHPLVGHPMDSGTSWLRRKCVNAFCTWVAPEVTVAQSLHQLCEAMLLKRDIVLIPGFEHFSLRQAFLVVIGGVYYEHPLSDTQIGDELWDAEQQPHQGSGNALRYTRLSPKKLLELAGTREITFDRFPENSDIDDRSKSDPLLKSVAIFQTGWFMANMRHRLALGYTISVAEVFTTPFALCGLIQLVAWIRCPQNIFKPSLLKLRSESEREKDIFVSVKPPISWLHDKLIRYGLRSRPPTVELEIATLPERGPLQDTWLRWLLEHKPFGVSVIRWLTVVIITSASLGIHSGAWSFAFRSSSVGWTWRSSALLSAVCTLFLMQPDGWEFMLMVPDDNFNYTELHRNFGLTWWRFIPVALAVMGCSYTRGRLLGTAYREFKNAPVGIYKEADWTAFVPHY